MSQSRKQQEDCGTTDSDGQRNYYKNKVCMFSPMQMTKGVPPRNPQPTDIRLKPDIRQMPLSNSSVGGGYRSRSSNIRQNDDKYSQKSALTEFADQRASARQHHGAPATNESQSRHIVVADCAGSSTSGGLAMSSKFENRPPSKTEMSSQNLRQSRSSSAFVPGTSVASHQVPAPFQRESSRNNQMVLSYVHTTKDSSDNRDGVSDAVQDYQQVNNRSSGPRTMKERKRELGDDREAAKTKKRRHKEDKKRKRSRNSRRQPEVVVVYRYPPPTGTITGNTSSEQSQSQTQTSQYYQSHPDLNQSSSAQTSLLSKDHPGYYIPGVPYPNSKQNVQILSMTSAYGQDFSNPISPSDLLVPLPHHLDRRSPSHSRSRSRNRGANGKELLDSQMVSHSKPDGGRSSKLSSRRSRSDNSQTRSKQRSMSQRRKRDSKSRQGGIRLYQPEQLPSSNRQNIPLTSSQLADDYIDRPAPQQPSKTRPLLYYKKLQSQGGNSAQFPMSHRPQEVVLSGDHSNVLMGQRKQSHKTNNSLIYRDQYSSSALTTQQPNQPYLSRSSSLKSSKMNLADYKTLISIQEQAYEQKLLQVKDHISSESKARLIDHQQTQQQRLSRSTSQDQVTPVSHKKHSRSHSRELRQVQNIGPSMRQSELQPIPDHEESQDKESLSPQKRRNCEGQMSLTGQSYLNYLNRVSKVDSYRPSVLQVRPNDSEPEHVSQKCSPVRHKSVDNAKTYAIYKIIGRLNTKRELERVAATSMSRDNASRQVQMRYDEAQERLRRTLPTSYANQDQEGSTLPKDGSKSSFIQRFERHARREASRSQPRPSDELQYNSQLRDQRSHSHLDLGAGSSEQIGYRGNHFQAESTFQARGRGAGIETSYPVSMRVSQDYNNQAGGVHVHSRINHQSTYYTLGPADQLSDEQQHHPRTSPLRNSVSQPPQPDYNAKLVQSQDMNALLSRVDSALTRSKEQLSYAGNIAEAQSVYNQNQTVYEDSQESLQSDTINQHHQDEQLKQQRLQAGTLYEHRLSELRRQCDQVQKLPEFYNDRVSELKQRTMEVKEIAKNYTSDKESGNYTGQVTTQNQSPERHDYDASQNHPMFLSSDYYLAGEEQEEQAPPVDASGSFVRQHDVTSSYLQEHQKYQYQQDQRADAGDLYEITERVETEQQIVAPNAEDYLVHENEATRNQAVERENIRNDQLFGVNSRPQVFSQQITMPVENDDYNDFELTKKLGNQPYSQATYRGSDNNIETHQTMTVQQTEGDLNVIEKDRLARRERRRQKRERKLEKLKQLHDLAQYSMSKIASGLTSNAGGRRRSGSQSSQVSVNPPQVMSPGQQSNVNIGSVFEEKRESVRSQVEKLACVRKEIKKLIKIQNQHGKLLHKLQSKGVIKNVNDSQASQGFSETEMSERQKQYQVAMSTNMLTQMQEIFAVMAKIQKKLDFEISERQKRHSQAKGDKVIDLASDEYRSGHFERRDSSFGGTNRVIEHEPLLLNPQNQGQHPQQEMPQVARNRISSGKNNASHGTNSTLFWETQNAQNNSIIFHGQRASVTNNANFGQVGSGGFNQVVQAYESNNSIVINPSSAELAAARTTQSDMQGSEQKDDNKGEFFMVKDHHQQMADHHQRMVSQTNPTEEDEQEETYNLGGDHGSYQMYNNTELPRIMEQNERNGGSTLGNNTFNSSMSPGLMTLQGIRVDQLCEILSREIGRVREDSIVHANEMRAQYEMELQALRNEFYGIKTAGYTQDSQGNRTQTPSQLKNYMHHNDQTSQERTHRQAEPKSQDLNFHQLAEFPPTGHESNLPNTENKVTASQAARTQTEMNVFSQQMFDELQKVKAERDLYYDKLLKVRQRIERGKGKLPKVNEMVSQRTTDNASAGISEVTGLDHQESVSQRTPNETMRDKREHRGAIQNEFTCLEDQRNVRSVNQIVKSNLNQFDHQWPSQEAQSNTAVNEIQTFKHDFSDRVLKNNTTNLQSLESDPSSFNAIGRHGGITTNPNSSQHTKVVKQAGKIVHQTRSYETSDLTTKTRQIYGEPAKGTNQYINVRHNKTSMLRQNKALVKKCQKCLMDTFEDCNASFRSDMRSNRSGTRGTVSNAMSSLNNDRSPSQERTTMCQCSKAVAVAPWTKKGGPYINKNPGGLDSSAMSNSSHTNVNGQRGVSTPQEIMTFSARGNSTFNSQIEPPSKSIGGNQSIQSMVARSPNLISRLAAEHEQYLQQIAAQDCFDNSQMMQQTGGPVSDNNSTFDNHHKESQALSVINHYLEKYDKK